MSESILDRLSAILPQLPEQPYSAPYDSAYRIRREDPSALVPLEIERTELSGDRVTSVVYGVGIAARVSSLNSRVLIAFRELGPASPPAEAIIIGHMHSVRRLQYAEEPQPSS